MGDVLWRSHGDKVVKYTVTVQSVHLMNLNSERCQVVA